MIWKGTILHQFSADHPEEANELFQAFWTEVKEVADRNGVLLNGADWRPEEKIK
jgi:hypothetical protein